jgi:aminoglycoside 3-N-acetyltransferase
MTLTNLIPAPVKPGLKFLRQEVQRNRWITRMRRRWVNTFYRFGPPDLTALLRRLGIVPGDVVIVHSSFDRFAGFDGSLSDAIQVLQDVVGREGALLMPTLPFSGVAVDYARQQIVFDVKRTPSRVGLMTEFFRRRPGVLRSLHPTHPVAGWGAKAPALLGTHRAARTPCGAESPFAKLLDVDGKVLLLGVDAQAMTFFHYLEEELEERMPVSPFTTESFSFSVRDERGEIWPVHTRLYNPAVAPHRDVRIMVPHLKARGFWRRQRVGRLDAILLRCRDVRQTAHEMAAQGRFCYHTLPRHPGV